MPTAYASSTSTDLFLGDSSSKRPSLLSALGELRAPFEGSLFWISAMTHPWPKARPGAPMNVMLIPGFMAGDATLIPMATFIQWLGHRTFFSGIWSNSDCPRDTVDKLGRKLANNFDRFGQPAVIVGQSLGGVYARALAREFPTMVERAITLGSPIRTPRDSANVAVQAVARTVAAMRGKTDGCLSESCKCGMMISDQAVSGVPVTAVFSRTDGVVHWEACVDNSGAPEIENVEVMGSHCGMGINPDVCRVIADRLVMPRRAHAKPAPARETARPIDIGAQAEPQSRPVENIPVV